MEVCPEILGVMLEYWYIERGILLFATVSRSSCSFAYAQYFLVIAVSLLRPVIGSNVEIDVVALN